VCFDFLYNLCLRHFHSKRILWNTFINVHRSTCKVHSCQFLMKHELSQHIFKKYSNIECHENPSSGSRVVACEQTDKQIDRHDKANGHILQFCDHLKKEWVGEWVCACISGVLIQCIQWNSNQCFSRSMNWNIN
jgi:hypothetical protein